MPVFSGVAGDPACRGTACGCPLRLHRVDRQQVDRLVLQPVAGLLGQAVSQVDGHLAAERPLQLAAELAKARRQAFYQEIALVGRPPADCLEAVALSQLADLATRCRRRRLSSWRTHVRIIGRSTAEGQHGPERFERPASPHHTEYSAAAATARPKA